VQVILYKDRIELVPLITAKKARDFIKGISTTVERETNRI
jgi:hypothetical protein